jgi:cytoskeletal protein RodZ
MSLEIALAENTAAIRELIAKLSTGAIIPQDAEKPATTKGATGTTKKDTAQSSEPTPTASDNSASSSDESNEAAESVHTYEDAKTAVLKLGKVKGRQATLDALSRFGATKLPDVKPESFGALIALVDEVIAGGKV